MSKDKIDKWRPRLSVELSDKLYKRLQDSIPWGLRTILITTLLEDVLDMIDKQGDIVIAFFIKKKLRAEDLIRKEQREDNNG